MERIKQPKTAVPLRVQQVLDAMTEDNWLQSAHGTEERMCFLHRAWAMYGIMTPVPGPLTRACFERYGMHPGELNDRASSLSDFKAKIVALYADEGKP